MIDDEVFVEFLDSLPPMEQLVVSLYYGLDSGKPIGLRVIAKKLDLPYVEARRMTDKVREFFLCV